jgi:predicted  nucleic acid-binding Zn-ribbon protein
VELRQSKEETGKLRGELDDTKVKPEEVGNQVEDLQRKLHQSEDREESLRQDLQAKQSMVESANSEIAQLQEDLKLSKEALDEAVDGAKEDVEDGEEFAKTNQELVAGHRAKNKTIKELRSGCERAEEALRKVEKAKEGKSSCHSALLPSLTRAVDDIVNTKITSAVVVFQADPLTDTSPGLHGSPVPTPSSPAVERTPTISNNAGVENESNTAEPKTGSGAIRVPVKFSPPKRQRVADGQDTPRPAKAPRSDLSDASGDKLFPKLDDTVTTRKAFNSGGSPASKLFARQPSVVIKRDSADDSSPETETPAGGSKKRMSPAQSPQDSTAGSAKRSRLAVATEIVTPASVPGHPHLDTDSTGNPITSFAGLLRATEEIPIAKMLARSKLAASSKLPVPTIGAPTRKSSRLSSMDVYTPEALNERALTKRSMSPEKGSQLGTVTASGTGSPSKKPAPGTGASSKVPTLKGPSISPKKKGASPKKKPVAAPAPVENDTRTVTKQSTSSTFLSLCKHTARSEL